MIPADWALLAIRLLAGIGLAVSTLEYLAIRSQFAHGGVFSWRVISTRGALPRSAVLRWVREILFDAGLPWILALRLAAALCMFVPQISASLLVICLGIALGTSLLLSYRTILGGDGSDQMLIVVLAGLLAYHGLPSSSQWRSVGIWFIALQSVLAYFTAGMAKAVSSDWRRGTAIPEIAGSVSYGSRPLAKGLQRAPAAGLLLCWSVIVFEVLFPAALAGYPAVTLSLLAVGVAFHLGTALFMGLNCFIWAFAATYPAVYLCSMALAGHQSLLNLSR